MIKNIKPIRIKGVSLKHIVALCIIIILIVAITGTTDDTKVDERGMTLKRRIERLENTYSELEDMHSELEYRLDGAYSRIDELEYDLRRHKIWH